MELAVVAKTMGPRRGAIPLGETFRAVPQYGRPDYPAGPAELRERARRETPGDGGTATLKSSPSPHDLPAGAGVAATAAAGLDDDALMRRVQAGDSAPLAALFDRYQAPLLNFYLRMIGDRAASEDLVQEVFVRVLKYRKTYRPGSRFAAWMYSIARNVRMDYTRKRASQGIEIEWDESRSPAVEPGDAVEVAQNRRLLALALARLPEAKREVLVLARYHGLRYEEIGQILDCEPGTIKVRVHRALAELRRHFHRLAQGEMA